MCVRVHVLSACIHVCMCACNDSPDGGESWLVHLIVISIESSLQLHDHLVRENEQSKHHMLTTNLN